MWAIPMLNGQKVLLTLSVSIFHAYLLPAQIPRVNYFSKMEIRPKMAGEQGMPSMP